MIASVRRATTKSPKSECGRDLKELIGKLTNTGKYEFTDLFKQFIQKHAGFLQERNHKGGYLHEDIVTAVNSIHNNLNYLFTYERYPHLNIPKTTNSAEGSFGQWKYKVKLHRGLRKDRMMQMIDSLLMNS